MPTTTADLEARFPIFSSWMQGTNADHPYANEFAHPDSFNVSRQSPFAACERILATLTEAKPLRLDGRRREFRSLKDDGALRTLRTELVFGAYLASHRISFEFGAAGSPQPDFVLNDYGLGIELTHRRARPGWDLGRELVIAAKQAGAKVHLTLDFSARPFAIRKRVRDRIGEELLQAIDDGDTELRCVVRPPRPGQQAITLKIGISPRPPGGYLPTIRHVESGPLLTPMMTDVEDALVAAMEDRRKSRQGASMPSILVVDIADIDGAWIRSRSTWGDRLVRLIEPEHNFIGLAVMVSSWWQPNFDFTLGESPHATPQVLQGIGKLERALGLTRLSVDP